jgi:hypothetical protein
MRVRRRRHRDDDAIDQLVAGVGPVVPVEELVGGIGLRADSGIADSLMPARSLARPVPARTVEGRGTPPQMRATEQRPTTGDSASAMTAETVQPFEADVGRVLDLVINSLYKEREIFLRELVSNASDACDKLRYASLAAPELLDSDPDLRIRVLATRRRAAHGHRQRRRHEPRRAGREPRARWRGRAPRASSSSSPATRRATSG